MIHEHYPEYHGTTTSERLAERLDAPMRFRRNDPIRLESAADLAEFQRLLGNGWHEPNQWGLDAMVCGGSFDNAGFWGRRELAYQIIEEQHVVFMVDGYAVAAVNLASLCDWATRYGNSG